MNGTSRKENLRHTLKALRRIVPQMEKDEAAYTITRELTGRREWQKAQCICLYISKTDEVSTKHILIAALNQQKIVVLPKTGGGRLTLHRVNTIRDLTAGKYALLEPKKSCNVVPVKSIDLFIVPGIAFDRHGNRLGWGKGYYDRLLAGVSVPRIGLAYAFQVVAEVPHTSYDVPMTVVLSEKETIHI